jgi:hypothetical protein
MTTIYAIHAPETEKLKAVIGEMREMGAPTIEVIDCGDYFQALEGSHRLAAAYALGLEPDLVVHAQDEQLDIAKYDWFDPANWGETTYSAGEVAGELFSPYSAIAYSF